MKCPYCLENFHEKWDYLRFTNNSTYLIEGECNNIYGLRSCVCPSCNKITIQLGSLSRNNFDLLKKNNKSFAPSISPDFYEWILIKPKAINRAPLPKEVPLKYATDYNESCLVLPYSPKASAALSRRCLQNLLIEKAGAKGKDLSQQMQYVLDSKELPSDLAEALDAIRNIGNFAAHPIKSKSSGEIIEVEPGEAEWNLDILEALFDFYFVRPAILAKKKEALNEKLKEAGKPLMKEG